MSRALLRCKQCNRYLPDRCICGDDAQDNYLSQRTAEYQMNGYKLTEAKEKAMSDWHTYEASNATPSTPAATTAPLEGSEE